MKYKEALTQVKSDTLRSMAKWLGLIIKSNTRKNELIEMIYNEVMKRGIKYLYDKLSPLEKILVNEVVYNNFIMIDREFFQFKHNTKPPEIKSDVYGAKDITPLYFIIINKEIPEDIREEIKLLAGPPIKPQLKVKESIEPEESLTIKETVDSALIEVREIIRLIKNGKITVTERQGVIDNKSIKLLSKVFGEEVYGFENSIKSFGWVMLFKGANLITQRGRKIEFTKEGENIIKKKDEEILKILWNRWVFSNIFDELSRTKIKGLNRKRVFLFSPSERKKKIDKVLRTLPLMKWIAPDEFYKFMVASKQKFEVCKDFESLIRLYFIYPDMEEMLGIINHWRAIELRYLYVLIFEYMATLGIVDIAYTLPSLTEEDKKSDLSSLTYYDKNNISPYSYLSIYDGLRYFRINKLGAYILGMEKEFKYETQIQKFIQILPNMEIVIVKKDNLPFTFVNFLEDFTEKTGDYIYKITRNSILKGLENNISLEEMFSFLENYSLNKIPDSLRSLFEEIKEKTKSITYTGKALLLKVINPFTANIIINHPSLKNKCFYFEKNNILVVPENEVTLFKKVLKDMGYFVRLKSK